MVTVAMAEKAYNKGLFKPIAVTDADMLAGQNDGSSVSAGNVAELAKAEIGEDGKLGNIKAVIVGQPPAPNHRTARAKPTTDVQNSTPADVPNGTEVAVVGREKEERGGDKAIQWSDEDDFSSVSKVDREAVEPRLPVILEGEMLAVNGRNESTSFTPSFSDSTYRIPVMAWNGKGL